MDWLYDQKEFIVFNKARINAILNSVTFLVGGFLLGCWALGTLSQITHTEISVYNTAPRENIYYATYSAPVSTHGEIPETLSF